MIPLTYLDRLLDRLAGKVHIHRNHLLSLDQLSHPSITSLLRTSSSTSSSCPPLAIFLCIGLGASTLSGVEDPLTYPTRGQTVKIHAPWVKAGFTRQIGHLNGGEGGERTYIIPRSDGDVILGGTRDGGDWFPFPRKETTRDIIERTLKICPELCPLTSNKDGMAHFQTQEEKVQAVERLVVANLVGFRPSRKSGTRLERGLDLQLSCTSPRTNGTESISGIEEGVSEKTIVIYNYGHGGAGWQSSWGCAEEAVDLLLQGVSS